MLKGTTLSVTAVTITLLSGAAIAEDMLYANFPITVNGYTGKKTTSVSYTGQIARHVLHDSLKKLASSGDGTANPDLKTKMLSILSLKFARVENSLTVSSSRNTSQRSRQP